MNSDQAPPRKTGETILIVDDEAMIRTVTQRALERNGYRTLQAKDGAEALETVNLLGDHIGVIVLDLTMPGMSGAEVLSELQRLHSEIPVLLSSGYTRQDLWDSLKKLVDTVHFIQKPYSMTDLLAQIDQLLGHTDST